MISAMKYMLVSFYIEKCIFIIDSYNVNLFKIPFKVLSAVIGFANNKFAGRSDKIFILNPNFWLLKGWNLIKNLLTKEQSDSNYFNQKFNSLRLRIIINYNKILMKINLKKSMEVP